MNQTWHLLGTTVGAPTVRTADNGITVTATATAHVWRSDSGGDGDLDIPATVILTLGGELMPSERAEASDVKALVARAIDRAVSESRAAAEAFIEAAAAEPPQPAIDVATLRTAYRDGYVRGSYDAGADPVGTDTAHYRFVETHDLGPHFSEAVREEALQALNAASPTQAA